MIFSKYFSPQLLYSAHLTLEDARVCSRDVPDDEAPGVSAGCVGRGVAHVAHVGVAARRQDLRRVRPQPAHLNKYFSTSAKYFWLLAISKIFYSGRPCYKWPSVQDTKCNLVAVILSSVVSTILSAGEKKQAEIIPFCKI